MSEANHSPYFYQRARHWTMGFLSQLFSPSLKKGEAAPNFALLDQQHQSHKLSDYQGKWVVLFFYPKDFTFFCTKEVCSFRDEHSQFLEDGIVVLGVSTDSVEQHKSFAEQMQVPYPLLADTSKKVAQDYGVLLPGGIANRVTFIIDPQGRIADVISWANWFEYGPKVQARLRQLKANA